MKTNSKSKILIILFDAMPENLTYPLIQPFLFEKVTESTLFDL